jgi:hypothetical protein
LPLTRSLIQNVRRSSRASSIDGDGRDAAFAIAGALDQGPRLARRAIDLDHVEARAAELGAQSRARFAQQRVVRRGADQGDARARRLRASRSGGGEREQQAQTCQPGEPGAHRFCSSSRAYFGVCPARKPLQIAFRGGAGGVGATEAHQSDESAPGCLGREGAPRLFREVALVPAQRLVRRSAVVRHPAEDERGRPRLRRGREALSLREQPAAREPGLTVIAGSVESAARSASDPLESVWSTPRALAGVEHAAEFARSDQLGPARRARRRGFGRRAAGGGGAGVAGAEVPSAGRGRSVLGRGLGSE